MTTAMASAAGADCTSAVTGSAPPARVKAMEEPKVGRTDAPLIEERGREIVREEIKKAVKERFIPMGDFSPSSTPRNPKGAAR